jgi:hypothetical protein
MAARGCGEISNEQVHTSPGRAFYQAAAEIEARPDLYDFYSKEVGEVAAPPVCGATLAGR